MSRDSNQLSNRLVTYFRYVIEKHIFRKPNFFNLLVCKIPYLILNFKVKKKSFNVTSLLIKYFEILKMEKSYFGH